jgi:C4-dicarboxylate transporter DctM subunit
MLPSIVEGWSTRCPPTPRSAALFIAGVVPGMLLRRDAGGVTWYIARKNDYPRLPQGQLGRALQAFRERSGVCCCRHRDRRHLQRHLHADRGRGDERRLSPSSSACSSTGHGLKDVPRAAARANMSAMLLYIITNAVLFSFS